MEARPSPAARPRGGALRRFFATPSIRLIILCAPLVIAFIAALAGVSEPERGLSLAALLGVVLHAAGLASFRRRRAGEPSTASDRTRASAADDAAYREEQAWTASALDEVRQRQLAHAYLLGALKGSLTDESAKRLAADAEDTAHSARALLEQMVEVARFAAASAGPRPANLHVNEAMAAAARETRMLALSRGVRVRSVKSSAQMHADPILTAALLKALLVHAIVSAAGAKVLIGVRRAPEGPRFEVWTTGGLPRGLGGPAPVAARLADLLGYKLTARGLESRANGVAAIARA